jgi:hypothetical protein
MSSRVDNSTSIHLIKTSLWGVARGIAVHSLIYPLEVVKIRQQCSGKSEKSYRIALTLFRQEGAKPFYQGLSADLLRTSLKQLWSWPMMTGLPLFLEGHDIADYRREIFTGLAIATIDAAVSTPLERMKITSAFTGKSTFSFSNVYKDGWTGFTTHWTKLCVNRSTFLTAQKYFRDRAQKKPEEKLSLRELTIIGVKSALVVSVIGAPFDMGNTLKQALNISPTHLFSRKVVSNWYRGWPLSMLCLAVHNVASAIVIDKLEESRKPNLQKMFTAT